MRRIFLAVFMLFACASFAFAQATAGRLLGTVSGPDGLVPGVTVTLTDNQTGRTRTTNTDGSGGYKFENVSFGTYTVKFSNSGFKTFTANSVIIETNREYSLSPKLEIGAVTAEVTIQAGAEVINSTNAELSETIGKDRIIDLPINGRNPLALLNLQAGVNRTSSSISGQRSTSVNYTRDGVNVQDQFIRTGGFVEDLPSVDDTAEFTVSTQNANASLGNGGSTQVQFTTPRGGDSFSGALYWNNRNSALEANGFSRNSSDLGKRRLNRNQFGGSFGGPLPLPGVGEGGPTIVKNRANFFFNYERDLINQSSSVTNTVLLQPYRDGTFSYLDGLGNTQTINVLSGAGLDLGPQANADNFAATGGAIGVDPTIQSRFLNLTPSVGNGTDVTLLSNGTPVSQQLLGTSRNNTVRDAFTMRLDFEVNANHNFYFVHKWRDETIDRPDADVGFDATPFVDQTSTTRSFTGNYNAFLGSNFTNTFTLGYRESNPFFNESNAFPTDFLIGALPFGLSSPEASFQNQGRTTDQITIANNASVSFGNHTLRFGGEANILDIVASNEVGTTPIWSINNGNVATPALNSALFPGGISGPDLTIARNLRFLLGGFVETGSVQANFLGVNQGRVLGASNVDPFEQGIYGLYVQDQWRIRPDLTLNLGVRWDYFSPLQGQPIYLEPDLRGTNTLAEVENALLDPNGQLVIVGTTVGTPGQFVNADLDNFAPVLGVAYNPTLESGFLSGLFDGNTTIRGGFRMSTVNDSDVTALRNSANANAGLDFAASATNLNARINNLPAIPLPPVRTLPISFAQAFADDPNFTPTLFAIDPNLQNQQTMEWNVGIQREIGFRTVVEARYVGGYSDELFRGRDLNQIDINAGGFLAGFEQGRQNCRAAVADRGGVLQIGSCSAADIVGTGLPGQAPITTGGNSLVGFLGVGFVRDFFVVGDVGQFAQVLITNGLDDVPFRANPNGGNVDILSNSARYAYNAMQLEVRRRFSDGLDFQANYTFQKVLSSVANDSQARFNTFLDNNNPDLEYARANYDRTHTININSQYELPFGKGRSFLNQGGIVDAIFGGWTLNNIMNIGSGAPISIRFTRGTLNRGGRSADGTAFTNLTHEQVRDLIGIREVNGIRYFIDPSVIAPNGSATGGNFESTANANFAGQVFFASQPGETGNLPRNFINGPWYWFWDMGLRKNFSVAEKLKLQVRADAFNVLNNTFFNIAENSGIFNIESTTFGQIPDSSARTPRIVQLGLRIQF